MQVVYLKVIEHKITLEQIYSKTNFFTIFIILFISNFSFFIWLFLTNYLKA